LTGTEARHSIADAPSVIAPSYESTESRDQTRHSLWLMFSRPEGDDMRVGFGTEDRSGASPSTASPTSSSSGDDSLDRVVTLVYNELRSIAHRHLRAWRHGRDGHGGRDDTLSTTAVVHEAYLKLGNQASWRDRAHFLAIASVAMRQVLVDEARARTADKRGGGRRRVTLDDVVVGDDQQAEVVLEIDDALTRLAGLEPRLARVVECRFFGGLSWKEIAQVLSITPRTAQRDWERARALLHLALTERR
jgi:RNA polymerase sigma factor (TIGR02999 family)